MAQAEVDGRRVANPPRRLKTYKKRQHSLSPSTHGSEARERLAKVILHVIRAKYATSALTRDDVLTLVSHMRLGNDEDWASDTAGVNDTSTGTRYNKVCAAVQHLVADQKLVELDWLRICLPQMHAQLSQAVPPKIAYLPTIRRLVQEFGGGAKLDAMAVVDRWQSDQHLPENVKRMAVRGVLPTLVREGILQRGDYKNEFRVKV